ncbi:type I-E CRISPR-associated protein Cse1/CasA [Glycomyces sp. NPDC046736]|uniref:type I-E CRISPR-associated protein Cse1/CasA n=1 Tax=Glycomyces sp. NPDC046736 TaxID=3155615 RepID=UPI00340B0AF2
MTPEFNLIDDPWILVERHHGGPATVSLTTLFGDAADFTRITGDLPTQALPILRLALAIVHRAIEGPATFADWKDLWDAKRLPAEDIADYLAEHRSRFDLFHPETPFYQVADLTTKKTELGLAAFIADVPTGNPKYATRAAEGLERMDFAEAARWLVHCHAFDLSGIKGAAEGDPRAKGGKSYPIGPGSLGRLGGVYAEGDNLAETLMLNLIPDEFLYGEDAPDEDDIPVWERDPHGPTPEDRQPPGIPKGLCDLYTWQSRRLRLVADDTGVTGALICQGDKLELRDQFANEPMTVWRRSEHQQKLLKSAKPIYLPRRHDPDRNVWRGLSASLPALSAGSTAGAKFLPPKVVDWIGFASNRGLIARERTVHYHATGIAYGTQEAVITEIIDDRLSVAVALFEADNRELAITVADAVIEAEKSVWALAALARDLARAAGGRDGVEGAGIAASVTAYAALDDRYRVWLAKLGPDTDTDAARAEWQRTVWQVVRDHGARLVAAAGPAAWVGRGEGKDLINTPLAELRFRDRLRLALALAFPPRPEEPA